MVEIFKKDKQQRLRAGKHPGRKMKSHSVCCLLLPSAGTCLLPSLKNCLGIWHQILHYTDGLARWHVVHSSVSVLYTHMERGYGPRSCQEYYAEVLLLWGFE